MVVVADKEFENVTKMMEKKQRNFKNRVKSDMKNNEFKK